MSQPCKIGDHNTNPPLLCGKEALYVLTGSCVHEHVDKDVPICWEHYKIWADPLTLFTCSTCRKIDGHSCEFVYEIRELTSTN